MLSILFSIYHVLLAGRTQNKRAQLTESAQREGAEGAKKCGEVANPEPGRTTRVDQRKFTRGPRRCCSVGTGENFWAQFKWELRIWRIPMAARRVREGRARRKAPRANLLHSLILSLFLLLFAILAARGKEKATRSLKQAASEQRSVQVELQSATDNARMAATASQKQQLRDK